MYYSNKNISFKSAATKSGAYHIKLFYLPYFYRV